jgi:hypothetical protein
MIMWIPQLICCGIHMKSEIPVDHVAPGMRASHLSPLKALTPTTHHLSLLTALPSEGQKHPT